MDDALSDRPAALAPIGFIQKVDDRAGLGRALDAIAVAVALFADLLEIPARVHEEINVLDLPHRRGPAVITPLRVLDRTIGRGKRRARVGHALENGRAACRERACQVVEIAVGADSLKTKKKK